MSITSTTRLASPINQFAATMPSDMKNAVVMFTVLPEGQEENALNFLKRMRGEFKEFFKKRAKVGRIPFFDFQLDKGEKLAQRIRDLSQEM